MTCLDKAAVSNSSLSILPASASAICALIFTAAASKAFTRAEYSATSSSKSIVRRCNSAALSCIW